jgi:hypothetical protein
MRLTKKSFLSICLSFCMLFSLLSTMLAKPVDAKTVRVAVIASLSGEVTVKKGGGFKTYDAYENMSLNQGDTLYTGTDSSVTLNLSNGDADVTLGNNAELNVSDLSASDGKKKSKLKIWAGSMWVKVKSLLGSEDEFELETPTAVMGVRGTQFFVGVDPKTGKIKMVVGAGKVSATTVTNNSDSGQTAKITYLYPTQQISLDSRDEVEDSSLKVDFIDIDAFIKDASPEVIKAIILNKAQIDKENDAFIAKKKKELEDGKETAEQTSLFIKDQAALDKVKQNLDNLIGNIAKRAVEDKKIARSDMDKTIEEANKKITDPNKKLDLDKIKELDKTAGVDPDLEKKKMADLLVLEIAKKKKQQEEDEKLAELIKRLGKILEDAKEAQKKIDDANKKAANEENEKAAAELKKQQQPVVVAPAPSTNEPDNKGNHPTPTPTPKVSLTAVKSEGTNGIYNLDINMSDFNGSNDIYAVEVHLLYNNSNNENDPNIRYKSEPGVQGSGIFDSETSADHIKEYVGTSQKELVYAITNFNKDTNVNGFSGTKRLVTIPFYAYSSIDTAAAIKVGTIVIVRKDANGNLQTINIPVDSIAPALINIKGSGTIG